MVVCVLIGAIPPKGLLCFRYYNHSAVSFNEEIVFIVANTLLHEWYPLLNSSTPVFISALSIYIPKSVRLS